MFADYIGFKMSEVMEKHLSPVGGSGHFDEKSPWYSGAWLNGNCWSWDFYPCEAITLVGKRA